MKITATEAFFYGITLGVCIVFYICSYIHPWLPK